MKYILDIKTIQQMFCPEEGILSKFSDTSELSIEEWLQEKEIEPETISFDEFYSYMLGQGYGSENKSFFQEMLDFGEHYQNLLSFEENEQNFIEFMKGE